MKSVHTHQGTCQACGFVQAVDNDSRQIAKHGYKVSGFGMFVGTCDGSGRQPAEVSVEYTHLVIANCYDWAKNADRLAELYFCGDLMVYAHDVDSGRRSSRMQRIFISVPMFGMQDAYVVSREKRAGLQQEQEAKGARMHAGALETHVLPRHGRPLFAVKRKPAPRVFQAGEVVKLNGRDFRLLSPRYGRSGGPTVKYWRGYFVIEALMQQTLAPQMYTPSMTKLRKDNPQSKDTALG
jgi:hypothetical protein